MRGRAALAMWWDMAPEHRAEFEHWHSHEHFPERLALPGFLRASRWLDADGGDGVFVLYELQDHASLVSPAYRQRLDAPSPWSLRMMPRHRRMQRAQCHVLASCGAVIAARALTLRFSPPTDLSGAALALAWTRLAAALATRPGLAGAHLLRHEAPAMAPTTEQRLRGGDAEPDAVALICGHDAAVLDALPAELDALDAAAALGLAGGCTAARHVLSLSALAGELADLAPVPPP